jgi:hypothetical protein
MSGLPHELHVDDRHVQYLDFDHVPSVIRRAPSKDRLGRQACRAPRARIERLSCEVLLIREVHLFNCPGGNSG